MKKYIVPALCFAFVLSFLSCKTLQQNLDARKNLAKCKYELLELHPRSVKLQGSRLSSVNIDALFRIENKSSTDVTMEKMDGTILLDNRRATTFTHKKVLHIKKGHSGKGSVTFSIPFKDAIKALGSMPKYISFDITVYMNIVIGKYSLGTAIPVKVKIKKKVPYKTIRKLVVREAARSLKGGSLKDLFR